MSASSYPRPRFRREETWRYKRVKPAWRSPKGKTSRVRRSKKGWPAVVKIGYSHPRSTRGLHPSGLREVLVWRPSDLETIDEKTQVVKIAHTVGENKRVLIIDEAKKRNLRILNAGAKKEEEAKLAPEPEPEAPPAEAETQKAAPEPKKRTRKKTATKKAKSEKRAK